MSISTCALREEGDRLLKAQKEGKLYISIHALREEGDAIRDVLELCVVGISIHALREEGDKTAFTSSIFGGTFLSTPSSRRATHDLEDERRALKFLSTPSARRATKLGTKPLTDEEIFLSTPSARRATLSLDTRRRKPRNFYPRPPRGGRLALVIETAKERRISIHALREEGDAAAAGTRWRA